MLSNALLALLWVGTMLTVSLVSATDYCDPSLCRRVQHIACNHSGRFGPECPSNAAIYPLTDEDKEVIVSVHNKIRDSIASGNVKNHPPACRMGTMTWDDELAKMAELNVKQCIQRHDACHNTETFANSGQSIGFSEKSKPFKNVGEHFLHTIYKWQERSVNSNLSMINSFQDDGLKTGAFTLLVTDRNIKVGCAASTFYQDKWYGILETCNYASTNLINHQVYKACQIPAEECTTGTHPKYTSLCSIEEKIDPNSFGSNRKPCKNLVTYMGH